MLTAIAEAVEGGVDLSSRDMSAKMASDAVEAAAARLQAGNSVDWDSVEEHVKGAQCEGAEECLSEIIQSSNFHAPNHLLLSALAQGIREGGWDLLSTLKKLQNSTLTPAEAKVLPDDAVLQPLLKAGPVPAELASVLTEYVECLLFLDPASAVLMKLVQDARRETSWHRPASIKAVLDREASATTDASARTALRTASQRLSRCAVLHDALALLYDGQCTPSTLDILKSCEGDQVCSGVSEVASSLGQRLSALGDVSDKHAVGAALVLETAILTPPHVPHNVLRALRMLKPGQLNEQADREGRFSRDPRPHGDAEKLREHFTALVEQRSRFVTVIQQLRDDLRNSAAQLYDVPMLQTALRRCGECIAGVQKRASTLLTTLQQHASGTLSGEAGEEVFRRCSATGVILSWELDTIAASLASSLAPERVNDVDQPMLLRQLKEAEALRTVPRLTLTELCDASMAPHVPALQDTSQRLQSLKKRSDVGLFVEPWEVGVIREALEVSLATQQHPPPPPPPRQSRAISPPPSGGSPIDFPIESTPAVIAAGGSLRTEVQRRSLRRNLQIIEEHLKSKINDLQLEQRKLLELKAQLRTQQEAAQVEGVGNAGLRERLRDTEVQLNTTRSELEVMRAQTQASHDEIVALVGQTHDGQGEVKRHRDALDIANSQLLDGQAQLAHLWKTFAPLVSLDITAQPDMKRLSAHLRERIEHADEIGVRLKAVVSSYIGTLDAPMVSPSRLLSDEYVADVETLFKMTRQILDKLVADVEGAQLVISQQNDLLRKARLSVVQSAADISGLGKEAAMHVSPRRQLHMNDTSLVSSPSLSLSLGTVVPIRGETPAPTPSRAGSAAAALSSHERQHHSVQLPRRVSHMNVPSRPAAPLNLPPAELRGLSTARSNSRTRPHYA